MAAKWPLIFAAPHPPGQLRNLEKAGKLNEIRYTPKGYCVAGVPAGIGKALELASLPLRARRAAIRLGRRRFRGQRDLCQGEHGPLGNPDGKRTRIPKRRNALGGGETFRNPALAKTMKIIAEKGVDAFYNGELADNLDRFMQENDGWARKSDLQAYRALIKTPIKGSYRGYEISVPGSPVGGPRILATLNILEHFNLAIMSWDDRWQSTSCRRP